MTEMKKTFLLIVSAAVVSAACSRIEPAETGIENTTVTLTATLENEATKTWLDGSNYVCWADGDEVWINGNTYTVRVDGNTATISGVTEADNYACVYPSGIVTSFSGGCKVKISLPSSQTITCDASGRQVLSLPMAAYGDGSGPLMFKNLCGLVGVTVSNTDKSAGLTPTEITVSTSDGEGEMTASLYGETWAERDLSSTNYNNDWAILASNIGSSTSSEKWTLDVSITGSPVISKGSSRTYYITVPVIDNGTRSKISVEMSGTIGSNSFVFSKMTTASTKTVGRNQLGGIPVPSTLCYEIKTSGTDWNGSGTASDPYQISCLDHWNHMADMTYSEGGVTGLYFTQVCDIDCGGGSLRPAGAYVGVQYSSWGSTYTKRPFDGFYDGKGHTLSNFTLENPNFADILDISNEYYDCAMALFPYVENGTIKNLTISYSPTFSTTSAQYKGGIAGYATDGSVLSNLTFSGTLTDKCTYSGTYYVGCIAGAIESENGTYDALTFDGTLNASARSSIVGGVAGYVKAPEASGFKSTSNSKINVTAISCLGGLVGKFEEAEKVRDFTFGGTIEGTTHHYGGLHVGGIFGTFDINDSESVSISNLQTSDGAKIDLTRTGYEGSCGVGGIAGEITGQMKLSGDIVNRATINFIGANTSYAGGIAAYADLDNTTTSLSNLTNTANVTISGSNVGHSYAGGLFGYFSASGSADYEFADCSNSGNISTTSDGAAEAGGLFGNLNGYIARVNKFRNTGAISAISNGDDAYAGGLVGSDEDGAHNCILALYNCENRAAVVASGSSSDIAAAGGLVGYQDSDGYGSKLPCIINCCNRGSVRAGGEDIYIGGLLGFCYENYTTIGASFAVADLAYLGSTFDDLYYGGISGHEYTHVNNWWKLVTGTLSEATRLAPSFAYPNAGTHYEATEDVSGLVSNLNGAWSSATSAVSGSVPSGYSPSQVSWKVDGDYPALNF